MNFEKVTAFLDSLGEKYGVPGLDCRIVMDHEEIYRHQAGFRDYARKQPYDGSELYDVYSATKVITMTAVMQLVEKGILDLQEPVTKYLPAFRDVRIADNYTYIPRISPVPPEDAPGHAPENPIRLIDLMTMTSGMSYDLDAPMVRAAAAEDGSTVRMMDTLAKLPLLFEPGTRYYYSLGHDVMAAVVEVASGERFADYLQNHIFGPLGLKEMTLHPGECEKKRLAAQWKVIYPSEEVVPEDTGNAYRLADNYDSGGAGLCCSVEDYSAFADTLACGGVGKNGVRILTEESIRAMAEPRLGQQQLKDFDRRYLGYSYGLGVRTLVNQRRAKSPIGEFGWDGAAGAFCLMDTGNKLSVFYAQQVLFMGKAYFEFHPKLRDLIYEAIFEL